MRWLLVGAMGPETLPLLRRLRRPRALTPRLQVGTLGGHEVGVATVGVGPQKAGQRTAALLARWRPDRVVSIGTCGALRDGLPVGTVVSAHRLFREGEWGGELEPIPGLIAVTLSTVRAPVHTLERRSELALEGIDVVEMEAAAVRTAVAAAGLRLPVSAVKVVSDLAGADEASFRPGPARLVQFKALALRLSEAHLAPALVAAILAS